MSSEGSAVFRIRVQPRASANQVVGLRDGVLHVRLTAPPVDGEANQECVKFLADVLRVRRSQVRLISGHKGREKTVAVDGLRQSQLSELLEQICRR
ncbi:MAG: DUF167 domain-containing protein [Armatimonadota bacterium]